MKQSGRNNQKITKTKQQKLSLVTYYNILFLLTSTKLITFNIDYQYRTFL
jgi:hypothetical protein